MNPDQKSNLGVPLKNSRSCTIEEARKVIVDTIKEELSDQESYRSTINTLRFFAKSFAKAPPDYKEKALEATQKLKHYEFHLKQSERGVAHMKDALAKLMSSDPDPNEISRIKDMAVLMMECNRRQAEVGEVDMNEMREMIKSTDIVSEPMQKQLLAAKLEYPAEPNWDLDQELEQIVTESGDGTQNSKQ